MLSSNELLYYTVDGVWEEWGIWGDCSVTCGGGQRLRMRVCIDPLYGGSECQGNTTYNEVCNSNPCPSKIM